MRRTRRALLAGITAGSALGVAGCMGSGDTGAGTGTGTGTDASSDTADGTASENEVTAAAATGFDCESTNPPAPDTEYRPTLGAADAPITIRAFEDFTCPHCATFTTEELPTVRADYIDTGRARYEHWDFPIPVNELWAVPVASAARGVGARNGDEAFFEFAEQIYASIGEYSADAVGEAAKAAGGDPCVALADMETETYAEVIGADRSSGVETGVNGTPTVLINGESVMPTADAIGTALEEL